MNAALILLSIALPWAAGSLTTLLFLAPLHRGKFPIAVGLGFFVGMFGTAAILQIQNWLGMQLHVPWLLLVIVLALLGAFCIRLRLLAQPSRLWVRNLDYLPLIVMFVIAVTSLIGAFDAVLRPVFPWDAWYLHAYKTHIYMVYQQLVPVVTPGAWLESADPMVFTTYTGHSNLISLLHAWPVLAAGQWQEGLDHLLWPLAGLAIALIFIGYALQIGYRPTQTAGIGLLVYTLPVVLVQSTLAGYADLWLAGFLVAGTAALMLAFIRDRYTLLFLAIPLLTACVLSKKFGVVYVACVLMAALTLILPGKLRNTYLILTIVCFFAGFVLLEAASELSISFNIAGTTYGIWGARISLPLIPTMRIADPDVSMLPILMALLFEEHYHIVAWIIIPLAGYAAVRALNDRACTALLIWLLLASFIVITPFRYTTSAFYLEIGTVHIRMLLNIVLVSSLFAMLVTRSSENKTTPGQKHSLLMKYR